MPAWIAAALVALRGLGPAAARGAAGGGAFLAAQEFIPGLFGGDGVDPVTGIGQKPRRRRRRRALTASDRADIAFITATLGVPAGKAFAIQLAARPL